MNIQRIFDSLKRQWPHLAIVASFVLISFAYFYPVLQGKELPQADNIHARGAAQELIEYEKETGELAQWTNSMFGGMPAYQIKSDATDNVFRTMNMVSRIGLPFTSVAILFLYLLGFYVLMVSFRMNHWLAFIGSLAFAFGSYNLIIIIAGHITKAYAIALMPVVMAGVLMIFNGKKILGGVFTMVALGMELAYNHIQITYYLALAILVMLVAKFVYAVRDKQLPSYAKGVAVLAAASVLAVLPGLTNIWTTYEYSKLSIRGASELTAPEGEKSHDGLDKDYALSWSYGVHETPTLLIPNVVGGASEYIGYDLKSVQRISDTQLRNAVAQSPKYWGGRSFTSGPVYAGAVMCFLFFIGCFFYKGREKWWLIAATILSIMLAWGKNFMVFTDFMFYYFPFYNKFRTVEMALVIASLTIPMLGMLGLKEVYDRPELIKYNFGKFAAAIGLSGGVALLIAMFPEMFYSFMAPSETAYFADAMAKDTSGMFAMYQQAIVDARIELTRSDAMRTVMFVLLASSALWFYSVRKINTKFAMLTLALLVAIDMVGICTRYLGPDKFEGKSRSGNTFVMSPADKAILADKEPHRVMPLYRDPFNEVQTSYFHHSVGGYHGAKLRRYQDMINVYLADEWQRCVSALRAQDIDMLNRELDRAKALKMLNVKYLIYNPSEQPYVNEHVLGAAWFVDSVSVASSADEAIASIRNVDVARVAVVETEGLASAPDSTSTIEQTSYAPDKITYSVSTATDRLAVFSEVYYPAGWKAFVDGKESEIYRADYILRALKIPAGAREVEFRFEPTSYIVGSTISLISSFVVVLLVVAALVFHFVVRKNKTEE